MSHLRFQFQSNVFDKFYPLEDDILSDLLHLVGKWGEEDPENQDDNQIMMDGTIQSIFNQREPTLFAFKRDKRLYKALACEDLLGKGSPVNMLGMYIDTIDRGDDAGDFKTLVVGVRSKNEIFLAAYPMIGSSRAESHPCRLLHLIPDEASGQKGTWIGAWAIPSDAANVWKEENENAESIMKHYKDDTASIGVLEIRGDIHYAMAGLIYLYESQWKDGPEMSANDAFEALLYSCKIEAMFKLQERKTSEEVFIELAAAQKQMEGIYNACTSKLQVFMMSKPEEFADMSDPLEELLGPGMGYTGLMYADRWKIIISICKELEVALAISRDILQEFTEDKTWSDFEVKPWNSKSQSSIYTKITDYVKKKVEPQILESCGIMGIKDYVRTRMIVKADPQACVDKYLDELRDGGMQIEQVECKDKSKRFAPNGKALYVTGYMLMPFKAIHEEGGRTAEVKNSKGEEETRSFNPRYFISKDTKEGDGDDRLLWAMPFEIQVVNQVALDLINKAHHAYEIERVCTRIAAVCQCTKYPNTKDNVPQLSCANCMFRRSQGLGYCPFCHICFKGACQKKNCKLPCCAGEAVSALPLEDEINKLDETALRQKILAMEAELSAWRGSAEAAGSARKAAKQLKVER